VGSVWAGVEGWGCPSSRACAAAATAATTDAAQSTFEAMLHGVVLNG
jgi:hypothetical protein